MHLRENWKNLYLLNIFGLYETLWIKDQGASIAITPIPFWYLLKVMAKKKRKG